MVVREGMKHLVWVRLVITHITTAVSHAAVSQVTVS